MTLEINDQFHCIVCGDTGVVVSNPSRINRDCAAADNRQPVPCWNCKAGAIEARLRADIPGHDREAKGRAA